MQAGERAAEPAGEIASRRALDRRKRRVEVAAGDVGGEHVGDAVVGARR
jgi:hypothetical protein